MKCVVINLERAYERRKRIVEQFEILGLELEIFTGVDGHELPKEDYFNYGDRHSGLVNWKHPNVPGMLGCWISHRQVWLNALDEGLDMIAVFEDDVTLDPNVEQVLSAVEVGLDTIPDFDIIFLDNRRPDRQFIPLAVVDHMFSVGLVRYGNLGTSGYIITRGAMQHLLRRYSHMPVAIDQLIHAGWKNGLQTFTLNPQVVFHGVRFVNHGSYVYSPIRMKRTWKQKLHYLLEFSIPKRVSYYRRANGFRHS